MAVFNRETHIGADLNPNSGAQLEGGLKLWDEVVFCSKNVVRKCKSGEAPEAILTGIENFTVNDGKKFGSIRFVSLLATVRNLKRYNIRIIS